VPGPLILTSVGIGLGGFTILRDVTVSVGPGEVIGVVGGNGSGKTTLIRMMATLLSPRSGDGSVLGARMGTSEVYPVRQRIGLISHIPAVIPELTLADHLQHVVRLSGLDTGRIPAALRAVGLDGAADRKGAESSFGMLRRTEVARLLIAEPEILLLDEAFSGLDSEAVSLIDAVMERTLARDGAVVIVSHDRSQMRFARRVFAIDGGTLRAGP
jgi:ABC-type multidrug transport system ATPase subunit